MKKKVIAMLLVTTLIASILTGCKSSNEVSTNGTDTTVPKETTTETADTGEVETTKEEVAVETKDAAADTKDFADKELNIAVFQGGYSEDYWNQIIELFQAKYPGVKVNMTISPKIGEIIRPQIIAGNPPDFISLNDSEASGVISALVKENGLLEITDVFEENALDKEVPLKDIIVDGMLESTKCAPYKDGKIYLAPFDSGPMGFVYNKTLFEQKGWEVPTTWDEFFALGDVAEKDGRALLTYQGIYPSYLESILFPTIANAGGIEAIQDICSYKEGSFKTEYVKKALDVIAKFAEKGYLMDGTTALNHTQSQADMMMGKALFIPNGTWMESEMAESPREGDDTFEFALMPVPSFSDNDNRYILSSYEQFSIPARAKNAELAKEFLKFLYTDESLRLFAAASNAVYAVKDGRELAKDYLTPSTYNMYSAYDGATAMMMDWNSLPQGTKIALNTEIFDNCVTAVLNGEMTTDEWMENVEKAFAQIRLEQAAAE